MRHLSLMKIGIVKTTIGLPCLSGGYKFCSFRDKKYYSTKWYQSALNVEYSLTVYYESNLKSIIA